MMSFSDYSVVPEKKRDCPEVIHPYSEFVFIRKTETKAGKKDPCFTCRLVQNVRDGQRIRQQTLLNLGTHFEIKQSDWTLLCSRILQLPFAQWDRIFPDQATAAAVDRLVHHATIFEINNQSYRCRAAWEHHRADGSTEPSHSVNLPTTTDSSPATPTAREFRSST